MFRKIAREFVGLVIPISLAVAVAGCRGPGDKQGAEAAPAGTLADASTPATPAGERKAGAPPRVLPAHFQATIYEVEAVAEKLNSVEGKALAKRAASAESLLGELSGIGKARVLYRFDQPVNLFDETLRLGSSEPVVTGSRTSAGGRAINQIQYQQVGAVIRISGWLPPKEAKRKGPDVRVSAELALQVPSDVETVPGTKVTSVRNLSFQNTGEPEYGKPQVMLAVSSTSTDKEQSPVMYVFRYVISR